MAESRIHMYRVDENLSLATPDSLIIWFSKLKRKFIIRNPHIKEHLGANTH